jgi:glycine dehydrogenase
MLKTQNSPDDFSCRHIGPNAADTEAMLKTLGLSSLQELTEKTVPSAILSKKSLDLPQALSEAEMLKAARALAEQNKIFKSFIGMGYYGTQTPPVILRNIMENPGWYTAYTPYQAEIAQGRLEALLNFQTMIMDLTAMDIANSSLLDEGTAAAEAMSLCYHHELKKNATTLFVSQDCHPQTIEVLQTRAEPLGLHIQVGDHRQLKFTDDLFAILLQYPTSSGRVDDYADLIAKAHSHQTLAIVAADLLALTLLKPPGEFGADVVIGSSQRFGVPLGFGGPHAAFIATREVFKRALPGRLVGVSIDSHEKPALRLALQTREQHIRREKATSNICTAQVLLAVMASMYAVYHGPEGLKKIAHRTHRLALIFAKGLKKMGQLITDETFFDTVQVVIDKDVMPQLQAEAAKKHVNLRWHSQTQVIISFDETSTPEDVELLWKIFAVTQPQSRAPQLSEIEVQTTDSLSKELLRKSAFLTNKVFNSYHSETEMLRYIFRLQGKDLSLAHSMIPLGSCTMKLNATAEMIPVTWPEFSQLHPFIPMEQAQGSLKMIRELEGMLSEITGFAGISLQPNAGSQGEYAGLLAIRHYHQSRGDKDRTVCLIPSSAHGTNPASAVMAGLKVVVTKCDENGNVDLVDLRAKAELYSKSLAAVMVTYPSTHGVFEEGISELCDIVHKHGGQVYMDGANYNAMVGLVRPGEFADVCHLNLHKTFCIPHGGGGPGVGPIGVREHLRPFLPGHRLNKDALGQGGAVSSAPFGSAGILCISWAYIKMMGPDGLKRATQMAILNANYMSERLDSHFPVLYKGIKGRVAHECILDLRNLPTLAGVTVEDVAKRLIDYGFHAPTMSWPVTGTLMVEPTESEAKAELDRFCDAMISIRNEITEVVEGRQPRENNVLKNAPHTVSDVLREAWSRPYSREKASFPLPWVREAKFWPAVGRVNNPYGDRNLVCSCEPIEAMISS